MESQYILRLPEELSKIDLLEATLTKISESRVVLEYSDVKYQGIITRPATIIETQKMLDGKLYKIADIRCIITILGRKNGDSNENCAKSFSSGASEKTSTRYSDDEIEKLIMEQEASGLTPPMKYCKYRRFKRAPARVQMVEEIESKVKELLKRDAEAVRIEILNRENEEIDNLAAEIENELFDDKTAQSAADSDSKVKANIESKVESETISQQMSHEISAGGEGSDLEEMSSEIKRKENALKNMANPIIKRRLEYEIKSLKEEYSKKYKRQ